MPPDHDDDDYHLPREWELVRNGVNAELAEAGFEAMTPADWHGVVFWLVWEARDLLTATRLGTIIAEQG